MSHTGRVVPIDRVFNLLPVIWRVFFSTKSKHCRDLLNSRKWKTYTSGPTFPREQENWRRGRTVNLTVTWNFGNIKPKRPKTEEQREHGQDDNQGQDNNGYNGGGGVDE